MGSSDFFVASILLVLSLERLFLFSGFFLQPIIKMLGATNFFSADPTRSTFMRLTGASDFNDYKSQTLTAAAASGPPTSGILDLTVPRPLPIAPILAAGAVANQDDIDARVVEIAAWDLACNRLFYHMTMNLGPQVKPLISAVAIGDAIGAWNILCARFQGSSISDTASNISKLIRLRMNGTLTTHIDNIDQLGRFLSANIAALAMRNAALPPGQHRCTIEEIMQIAVVMSTLPKHFDPVVQNLWLVPNLDYQMVTTALKEADLRWTRDHDGHAKIAEALAAQDPSDMSLPLTVHLSKEAGKPVQLVSGIVPSTGEKISLLCTYCSGKTHNVDSCFHLHPELWTLTFAKRGALAGASSKKIYKAPSVAAAHVAQDFDFAPEWAMPNCAKG
jgi:hypothetical protein